MAGNGKSGSSVGSSRVNNSPWTRRRPHNKLTQHDGSTAVETEVDVDFAACAAARHLIQEGLK